MRYDSRGGGFLSILRECLVRARAGRRRRASRNSIFTETSAERIHAASSAASSGEHLTVRRSRLSFGAEKKKLKYPG